MPRNDLQEKKQQVLLTVKHMQTDGKIFIRIHKSATMGDLDQEIYQDIVRHSKSTQEKFGRRSLKCWTYREARWEAHHERRQRQDGALGCIKDREDVAELRRWVRSLKVSINLNSILAS